MRRLRLRWFVPVAVTLLGLVVVAPLAGASSVDVSGCKASTTPGAEMGHYPAWPGNQSGLRVACVFNAKVGDNDANPYLVSSAFTIHDFSNVIYHNGAALTVTPAANMAAGSTTFQVTDCNGAMFNLFAASPSIAGGPLGGIQPHTFVNHWDSDCTLQLSQPTGGTAIPAGTSLKLDNSLARTVIDGITTNGSTTITSASAAFNFGDDGKSVSGTDIPDGTTITNHSGTTATMSNPATGSHTNQALTIGGSLEVSSTRTVNDATFTATNQIASSAAAFTGFGDLGLPVSGPGITQPCYISGIVQPAPPNPRYVTLSPACTDGSAGTKTVTIGDPTATAPANGDTALNMGVQLDVNPNLVPGSDPCASNTAEGFGVAGTWLNPGSFVGGPFATQPANTKAVGEILFKTAVVTFAAYIIERKGFTPGDPIGAAHYDIVFPNVPMAMALCSSATSPGLGFSIGIPAVTASVAALPAGTGRPGTAQLRSTRASTTGSTTTVYITSDDGVHTWSGSEFNRLCIVPSGPPTVNFLCGDG
jgi:hypothetical protein